MLRSFSTDLLKAISIFAVVWIHTSLLFTKSNECVEQIISLCRFCVPCFIILWALNFERGFRRTEESKKISYIKAKLLLYFKLYLIWSLFYFLLTFRVTNISFIKIITLHFLGFGWPGQYFFLILLQLTVLFPFIRAAFFNVITRYVLVSLSILLYFFWGYYYENMPELIRKLGPWPFFFWIPYVFIGIKLLTLKEGVVPKIFKFILIFIPIESYFIDLYKHNHSPYLSLSVLICSVIFCISFYNNDIAFKSQPFKDVIAFIGKNTMVVFVLNPLMIFLINHFLFDLIKYGNSTFSNLIIHFFCSSFILFVCLVIGRLFEMLGVKKYLF